LILFLWDDVKVHLKRVCDDFINGKLEIGRIFLSITLVPNAKMQIF
jgi:hypothetical protein